MVRKRASKLTDREIKILVLICRELSVTEISSRMKISDKTYFNHRGNIVKKTGAKTSIGLYKYALRKGFVKPSGVR